MKWLDARDRLISLGDRTYGSEAERIEMVAKDVQVRWMFWAQCVEPSQVETLVQVTARLTHLLPYIGQQASSLIQVRQVVETLHGLTAEGRDQIFNTMLGEVAAQELAERLQLPVSQVQATAGHEIDELHQALSNPHFDAKETRMRAFLMAAPALQHLTSLDLSKVKLSLSNFIALIQHEWTMLKVLRLGQINDRQLRVLVTSSSMLGLVEFSLSQSQATDESIMSLLADGRRPLRNIELPLMASEELRDAIAAQLDPQHADLQTQLMNPLLSGDAKVRLLQALSPGSSLRELVINADLLPSINISTLLEQLDYTDLDRLALMGVAIHPSVVHFFPDNIVHFTLHECGFPTFERDDSWWAAMAQLVIYSGPRIIHCESLTLTCGLAEITVRAKHPAELSFKAEASGIGQLFSSDFKIGDADFDDQVLIHGDSVSLLYHLTSTVRETVLSCLKYGLTYLDGEWSMAEIPAFHLGQVLQMALLIQGDRRGWEDLGPQTLALVLSELPDDQQNQAIDRLAQIGDEHALDSLTEIGLGFFVSRGRKKAVQAALKAIIKRVSASQVGGLSLVSKGELTLFEPE